MSRSDPPRSSIAERVRRSSPAQANPPAHGRSLLRSVKIRLVKVTLWLHIYVSMLGLAAVLFFSVTGLTLNHPDWFFAGGARKLGNGLWLWGDRTIIDGFMVNGTARLIDFGLAARDEEPGKARAESADEQIANWVSGPIVRA